MPRLGLLGKSALLLFLVFGGAALALAALYVPRVERRVRADLDLVAEDCLSEGEDLMGRRAAHLAERNRRALRDLPVELTAGDPEGTKKLLEEHAEAFALECTRNVAVLTRELRRELGARTRSRAAALARSFRREAFLGLLAILAAVVLLLGLGQSRMVLVPLGRLLRSTERVAAGDLSAESGISGTDEVGRLGISFDRMTRALRASREEIEELNRSLEARVREKTMALVHSQTMATIGTLAGGVAHEFNNLLGGIIGCAEEAAAEKDPAAVREALDVILRTARRACNITENLLRFSRPPAREPRPTDLAELAAQALDLIRPEAARLGVAVEARLPATAPVPVDPGQIHQVVLNLLANALRAMPSGGRLTVAVEREGDEARILVADTGTGIAEEIRSRIFEPFFTTRDGADRADGTGLGLSVSYSIVKAHGGRIEFETEVGRGTVFRVILPAEGSATAEREAP